jgi:hypothetical protein
MQRLLTDEQLQFEVKSKLEKCRTLRALQFYYPGVSIGTLARIVKGCMPQEQRIRKLVGLPEIVTPQTPEHLTIKCDICQRRDGKRAWNQRTCWRAECKKAMRRRK